ncbi:hypothetical protein [Prescottella agglutinans]|uniref:Fibronectin type-III domain-containing protein n=1 Tax=Prescottella agglutinans TaxID=1644129 RepID=A0ABT6MDJ3_9NOCA|nr:hypothetical protein [Prescottella agglutinans]MDH6282367.1 hypothetical protein [Prescottella agglutinans]
MARSGWAVKVGSRLKKRAMAVGFAVLAIFGVVQMSGTSAAFSDAAVAQSSFSSGVFYPTPLVQNISCSTRYVWGEARTVADISWSSPPTSQLRPGQSYIYRIKVVQDTDNSNVTVDTTTTGISYTLTNDGNRAGKGWYVRVFTVNGPAESPGWQSQGVQMASGGLNVQKCTGNNDGQPNPAGLAAAPDQAAARVANLATEPSATTATPTTSVTSAAPTTTGSTTSPPTTTMPPVTTAESSTSPPTTSTSPTSAESSTTTSSTPATTTPPPETTVGRPVALPDGGTAQLVDDDGRKVLIRKGSEEVCRVSVDESDELSLADDTLWLTTGTTKRLVDIETCAIE